MRQTHKMVKHTQAILSVLSTQRVKQDKKCFDKTWAKKSDKIVDPTTSILKQSKDL